MQLKQERQRVKELENRMKEEERARRAEITRRREINKKREEENARRGEVVQVVGSRLSSILIDVKINNFQIYRSEIPTK